LISLPSLGFLSPDVQDTSVQADVHGVIQGVPIPWPLHDADACHLSGLTCPLQPGNNYHYTKTFLVLKSYPKVSSSLQTVYSYVIRLLQMSGRLGKGTQIISEIQNS
jgi:hypothetical protein